VEAPNKGVTHPAPSMTKAARKGRLRLLWWETTRYPGHRASSVHPTAGTCSP